MQPGRIDLVGLGPAGWSLCNQAVLSFAMIASAVTLAKYGLTQIMTTRRGGGTVSPGAALDTDRL